MISNVILILIHELRPAAPPRRRKVALPIRLFPLSNPPLTKKSIDLLLAWNESVELSQKVDKTNKNAIYLDNEIASVRQVDKFRTVSMIRTNAFIQTLKDSFKDLEHRFSSLFHEHHHHTEEYYH